MAEKSDFDLKSINRPALLQGNLNKFFRTITSKKDFILVSTDPLHSVNFFSTTQNTKCMNHDRLMAMMALSWTSSEQRKIPSRGLFLLSTWRSFIKIALVCF